MKPTEELMQEHRLIETVLGAGAHERFHRLAGEITGGEKAA